MRNPSDTIARTIILILIILLAISMIVNRENTSTGYEASIYESTPLIVWISIAFSFISCPIIIIREIKRTETLKKSNILFPAILVMVIAYAFLLSIWIIRGYTFWVPGDPLDHLGLAKGIILSGNLNSMDYYPAAHIMAAMYSEISQIDVITICKLLPFLFGLAFPFFLMVFSNTIFKNKRLAIITLLCSIAPIFGWYFNYTPNHLAIMIFPFFLFVLWKSYFQRDTRWIIALILVILILPILHPGPALFFCIIAGVLVLGSRIAHNLSDKKDFHKIEKLRYYSLLISTVWILTWISLFFVWNQLLISLEQTFAGLNISSIQDISGMMKYGSGYGYNPFQILLISYGGLGLFLIIATGGYGRIKSLINPNASGFQLRQIYWAAFILLLLFIMSLFLASAFGGLRVLVIIGILCTPLAGAVIFSLLFRKSGERKRYGISPKIRVASAALFIVFVLIFGMLTVYPSSATLTANYQITEGEMNGMDWFVHHRDQNLKYTSLTEVVSRYVRVSLSLGEINELDFWKNSIMVDRLTGHFGYETNSSMGNEFQSQTYMIISEKDRIYQYIFPEVPDFILSGTDFQKLTLDDNVNLLYSGGGFDIYLIFPYSNNR